MDRLSIVIAAAGIIVGVVGTTTVAITSGPAPTPTPTATPINVQDLITPEFLADIEKLREESRTTRNRVQELARIHGLR